jgi:hypothetical protein
MIMLFECMTNVIKSKDYVKEDMIADIHLFKSFGMLTDVEYINLTKLIIEYPPTV